MAGVQIEIRSARRARGVGGDGGLPSASLGHLLTNRAFLIQLSDCEGGFQVAVK
jgi:hypothetical protein